jgi:molecular chaperone GrpE
MTDPNTDDDTTTPPPTGLQSDLDEAKKLLADTEAQLSEMTEMAQRTAAEFQNFKRRNDEERGNLKLYANLHFLQAIFPVMDNFQRAFAHMPENLKDDEWVKGIVTIEKQFITTLTSLGLHEIPCEVGNPFDPNLHEVLTQGKGDKDSILECFEKGYTFNDMVVRPAKVQVGSGE